MTRHGLRTQQRHAKMRAALTCPHSSRPTFVMLDIQLLRKDLPRTIAALETRGFAFDRVEFESLEAERKRVELRVAIDEVVFEARPGKRLQLGISIGAAVFPHDGSTYEELLATADSRMYRDKTKRKRQIARTNAEVLERSLLLNTLIQHKAISCTKLFADIESVLPNNVKVIQILLPHVNSRT